MVSPDYVLALDLGTSSCRAILFDKNGQVVSSAQQPIRLFYPRPAWVEQDPDEILNTTLAVLEDAVANAAAEPRQLAAIGITNQRETIILWDRLTGRPVYPAIVWQCRRTAAICEQLQARGLTRWLAERTGLVIDAYFSATKLMWLLDELPGVRARAERGELLAGTIDSWLVWHLSGRQRHITDVSNASRTMLCNLQTGSWDDDILRELNIPRCILPEIVPSAGQIATLDPVILPGSIPIAGIAGDQQAALFGQACWEPGLTKNTYGTGCFTLMYTGKELVRSTQGLLTTIAWDTGSGLEYALEGSVFNAGSAIQWLRDSLGIIGSAVECDRLAESVPDTGGVYFVPAFTGLGAPHWDMQARGLIAGLTRGSGREQLARAVLESIAHQTLDLLECMKRESGHAIPALRVDGGASASNIMMQFQADIAGIPVDRPFLTESTAYGAACLAGLAVGLWPDRATLAANRRTERLFVPTMNAADRVRQRDAWQQAVQATIRYGKPETTA
jgi:glycerol kinase